MENRKSRERKWICSELSVNIPGNPWSQSRRRNGRLWCEGFAEKESFKPGVKEWRGDGWWEWWVDGTDGGSATHTTGWGRIGEIGAWLTEGSRELIPETREAYWKERSVIRKEDDVDGRAWPKMKSECCEEANCDEVMQIWRLGGCENFVGKWEELVFNALSYL